MTLSRFALIGVSTLLLFILGSVNSYAGQRGSFGFSHSYLKIPDSLVKVTAYEEAIMYYTKAKLKFEKDQNWPGVVKCNNRISHCYRKLADYSAMLKVLKETLKVANQRLGKNHLLSAETKFYFGEYYFRKNDSNKSLLYYDSVFQIVSSQNKRGVLDLEAADIYNGIGNVYQYRLDNYLKASDFFVKALSIRKKLLTEADFDLASIYYNMSTVNRAIGNYEGALEYGLKAVQLSRNHPYEKAFQANCVIIVANTYFDELQFKAAIHYYKKAIEIMIETRGPQDISLAIYYNNIGTAYNEIKEHRMAMQFFKRALHVNQVNDYVDTETLSDTYFNYGIAYQFLNKNDSSDFNFRKSLQLRRDYYGDKHRNVSINYQYIGDLFESQHAFDSALWYYQKALISGIDNFYSEKLTVNPLEEQIGLDQQLIMTLRYKARSLKGKYLQTKNRKFLDLAMNTFLLTDSAAVMYRNHFNKEGTKLILSYMFKNTYEDALEITNLLYALTRDDQYAFYGLQFMEQTKALYLREFIDKQKRFKSSVPDSLIEKDKDLITKLSLLKQLLIERKSKNLREDQIDSIQSKTFEYAQAHDALNQDLHKRYPDFFVVRYASDISKNNLNRKLSSNTVAVEYFWGEKSVYIVSLHDDKIGFIKLDKDDALLDAFNKYKTELTSSIAHDGMGEHFDDFTSSALFLYKKLVEPVISKQSKNIIIVPDGDLLYIPFDAFITKPLQNHSVVNYKALDYLIKDYRLNYQYSLVLMNSLKRIEDKPSGQLLGFAYSDASTGIKSGGQRDSRLELPGTSREVNAIASIVEGKYFYGDEATEKNFKLNASEFSVIHFALHGEANDSLSSAKLIFKNKDDKVEDGYLYPHELYSVKLNADLVVLSSCETGIGKLYDGEGTYSMGRGFVLAGCPSVVMTLWKINDDATSSLMTTFYQCINKGKSIDESLRESKLSYLSTTTELGAHPSNWAALVPLGEMSPVKERIFTIRNVLFFIGLIFLAALVGFIIRRVKPDHGQLQ